MNQQHQAPQANNQLYYQGVILNGPQGPPSTQQGRRMRGMGGMGGQTPYRSPPSQHLSPRLSHRTTTKKGNFPTESLVAANQAPYMRPMSYGDQNINYEQEMAIQTYEQNNRFFDEEDEDLQNEHSDGRTVTVFGFPREQVSVILKYFGHYGTIVEHWMGPEKMNWINIKFQSKLDAQMALNKNGKIVGDMMIGVKMYEPKIDQGNQKHYYTSARETTADYSQEYKLPSISAKNNLNPIKTPQPQSGLLNSIHNYIFTGW